MPRQSHKYWPLCFKLSTDWMVWGSNSGRGKRFFLLQNRPDLLWGPPRYWDSFPRIEQPRLEVDYSPPRSIDIKNKWSYTPYSPYMRSWRGWELELCLSLHFNLAIRRGTAVVGCSMNMAHISIQSVAPPPIGPKHTHYCAFPPDERTC